jgi:hypothetical protein
VRKGSGYIVVLTIVSLAFGPAHGAQGGISADEYYSMAPPPPVAVRIELANGAPVIHWRAPVPPPSVRKPGYDPTVTAYRVYWLRGPLDEVLIGETQQMQFTDKHAAPGTLKRYAVSAVQRSGQESSASLGVEIRVPK